jgi:prepilin-type N-terminal cleavage/methylation domain-containing protein
MLLVKIMKIMQKIRNRGFTIIEVMLVITIFGAVMIVVLLVVPIVNQYMRDHNRKSYVTYVAAQLDIFYGDHSHYPITAGERDQFVNQYLTDQSGVYTFYFQDPLVTPHSHIGPMEEISIDLSHQCNLNGSLPDYPIIGPDNNPKKFVVWTKQERTPVFCLDNAYK